VLVVVVGVAPSAGQTGGESPYSCCGPTALTITHGGRPSRSVGTPVIVAVVAFVSQVAWNR
jgi:hypothetical protein